MTQEVITRYHQLLESREQDGLDESRAFLEHLIRQKISYGGRQLCPFLRPKFLSAAWADKIEQVCRTLRGAIVKVKEAVLSDEALLSRLGLTDGERRLAAIDPGYTSIGVSTRLDAFLAGNALKFVELNAECPAGVAFSDAMQDEFEKFFPMRLLKKEFKIRSYDTRSHLLQHILRTYQEWGGSGSPRIAIVDWKEVSTYHEFVLSAAYFRSQGVQARFVDPRDLELRGNKLYAHGEQIDLIYRRVLSNDVLARPDECKELVKAYETRAVCVVNSFRAKMLHKKMLFALLHDPQIVAQYTPAEKAVVQNHIPWTVELKEGFVQNMHGTLVDLVPWALDTRRSLVLKPNDEYGGKGVVVGHTVESAVWKSAVKEALASPDPWILQDKVELPVEDFPMLRGRELYYEPRYVDLDPYLFRGECGGILTRLSATSLCNVTAGGGSVPTFVVES